MEDLRGGGAFNPDAATLAAAQRQPGMRAEMAGDTYLFIDGEYLRQIHRQAMLDFFGVNGELDVYEAKNQAGAIRVLLRFERHNFDRDARGDE